MTKVIYKDGHYEVYRNGKFQCSADTRHEAEQDREEAEESEAEDADRSDCVYAYVYGWKEENKCKELAEVIGCDEDEVVMFKHCGVVERSVYSRA